MKNTSSARRNYSYAIVAYFGPGVPIAWTFQSTSIAAAQRKARRLGMGGRQVMTDRAAQKILDAWRPR